MKKEEIAFDAFLKDVQKNIMERIAAQDTFIKLGTSVKAAIGFKQKVWLVYHLFFSHLYAKSISKNKIEWHRNSVNELSGEYVEMQFLCLRKLPQKLIINNFKGG